MKRVVATVRPFIFKQIIQVYDGDMLLDQRMLPLKSVTDGIVGFCKLRDVHEVDLTGSPMFTSKIKQELLDVCKFKELDINVNIY